MEKIKRLEKRKIRTVWNEKDKKFYFAIGDVVQVLTGTANPTDYLKKKRKREKGFSKKWGQFIKHLPFKTAGGKQIMNCANATGLFKIIQSVKSPIPESFKRSIAKAAKQGGTITYPARKTMRSKTKLIALKIGNHLPKNRRKKNKIKKKISR